MTGSMRSPVAFLRHGRRQSTEPLPDTHKNRIARSFQTTLFLCPAHRPTGTRGFVKIRHFGLLAPANVNAKLALARHRLAPAPDPRAPLAVAPAIAALVTIAAKTGEPPPGPAWRDLFRQITGIDLGRCRVCGQGNIVRFPLPVGPSQPPASSPVILDTS